METVAVDTEANTDGGWPSSPCFVDAVDIVVAALDDAVGAAVAAEPSQPSACCSEVASRWTL